MKNKQQTCESIGNSDHKIVIATMTPEKELTTRKIEIFSNQNARKYLNKFIDEYDGRQNLRKLMQKHREDKKIVTISKVGIQDNLKETFLIYAQLYKENEQE